MATLDPSAVGLFEDTASVFRALFRRLGDWGAENAEQETLRQFAAAAGITDQQLLERLSSAPEAEQPDVQLAWARLWSYRVVKILVLACQRYWARAATDLARLRITPALGYLRLEAETVALAQLFIEDPARTREWTQIRSQKDGQKFFRATQPRLKTILGELQLAKTYDVASAAGLHARMASVVRSIVSRGPEMGLPDQDVDSEDPFSFLLAVAYFHRAQTRVLTAFGEKLPGVSDAEWNEQMALYIHHVDALWDLLTAAYPGRVIKLEGEG